MSSTAFEFHWSSVLVKSKLENGMLYFSNRLVAKDQNTFIGPDTIDGNESSVNRRLNP